MQSPSSLIFLVLLGVWAAYFVQYWVRRRDHVATARSVEQFSEAMRVLERRDPLPRTDLSEQAPPSYAVHPARANRPQVLVKRAVPAEAAGRVAVTARIEHHAPGGADAVRSPLPSAARPAAVASTTSGATMSAATPSHPVRPRLRPSRRVRGLLFLASVAEALVIVPLVALSMLPVWALAPALVAVVAALAFLRSGVRAEQAMMRAHRRRQADLARLRSSAPVTGAAPRSTSRVAPAAARAAAGSTASDDAASTDAAAEGVAPRRTATASVAQDVTDDTASGSAVADGGRSPLDVALEVAPATPAAGPVVESTVVAPEPVVEQPGPDVMVPIVDDDDMPLTWDPVPVPRPTYTMKAKAQRPEVAPAAVTPDPAPAPVEVAADDADDAVFAERRVAGA